MRQELEWERAAWTVMHIYANNPYVKEVPTMQELLHPPELKTVEDAKQDFKELVSEIGDLPSTP